MGEDSSVYFSARSTCINRICGAIMREVTNFWSEDTYVEAVVFQKRKKHYVVEVYEDGQMVMSDLFTNLELAENFCEDYVLRYDEEKARKEEEVHA
jgi:hypothetical protein